MVEEYLISAAAAIFTAFLMVIISFRFFKEEGLRPEKRLIWLWAVAALLYIGAAFLFYAYGYSLWKKERYYIMICALPVLAFSDMKRRRIPNRYLLILCVLRLFVLVGEITAYPHLWTDFLIHACGGAAGSFFLMTAAYFLSRKKIGLGDVKLLTVTGAYLGFSLNYIVLFLSLVFAALWGLWNIWRKKLDMKDSVAFAPFVTAGLLAALLLGL